jgi:hypothetical protein
VTSCERKLAAPYACSSLALAASLFGVARAVRALLLLTSHQNVRTSIDRQFGIDKAVLPGERYWHG